MTTAPPRTVRRRLLQAASALTTPVVPQRYVQLLDPLFAVDEVRARVVSVVPETDDVVTVTLRPGAGWPGHTAGQHVSLALDVRGVRRWRTFTLSSAPERPDGLLQVTVRALPGGCVTPWLRDGLRPGAVVRVEGPAGALVLPERPGPTLLVTAGSGITPALAVLRSLAARGVEADVVHVHCARSAAAVVARAELHALAAAGRGYVLHEHLSDEQPARLDVARLLRLVPDALSRDVLACGPPGLLDVLHARWEASGALGRLRVERFAPPPRPAPGAGAGGTVHLRASGVTAASDGSRTLLEAGEDAGAVLPHGCRMGVCFSCVGALRSGAVRDLRDGTVRDVPGQTVQTCVSVPLRDCELDL